MARAGAELWLVGLNPEPFQRIRTSPLGQTLGDERISPNLGEALDAQLEQFDGTGRSRESSTSRFRSRRWQLTPGA